jgi:predicted DNA binding CopG/RHH family protein
MKKRKPAFRLNPDEMKLEAEMERGEWTSVSAMEAKRLRKEMVAAAGKDARVNLRLNPEDVRRIREKAEREGIPYQTLIGSVLHKFATDQYLDEKAVEAVVRKLGKRAAG